MKNIVVYNSRAGGKYAQSSLVTLFKDNEIKVDAFIPIGAGFAKKLKKFVHKKANIYAIGGDGTISAVAGVVAGSSATLIPLAGGTLNHFVKDLGGETAIEDALKKSKLAKPLLVDVGSVNKVTFVNNSSIGLYPSSLHARERFEDKFGKWPAAVISNIRTLVRFKKYDLEIKGRHIRTPFVFVGNNEYDVQSPGLPRDALNKGELVVFVARSVSRWRLAVLAAYALVGKAKTLNDFEVIHAKSLTIYSRHSRLSVSHDGEVTRLTAPLHYEILAKTLRVIA